MIIIKTIITKDFDIITSEKEFIDRIDKVINKQQYKNDVKKFRDKGFIKKRTGHFEKDIVDNFCYVIITAYKDLDSFDAVMKSESIIEINKMLCNNGFDIKFESADFDKIDKIIF